MSSHRNVARIDYAVHIFRGVIHTASFARVAAVATRCDGEGQAQAQAQAQVDTACEWLDRNAERLFTDHAAWQAELTKRGADAKARVSEPTTRKVVAGKD